jgi:hypothetical protein
MMIARIAGLALLALGVACWGAAADSPSPARSATLNAITIYNLGAGVLLVTFAALGKASGFIAWGAGLFHLALGAGFAASRLVREGFTLIQDVTRCELATGRI